MVPLIPQEIIDLVVDELLSDEDALKQCSLVSSSFLTESQKHLFATVCLDQDAPCGRLLTALKSNPRLATYIRHLTISDKYSLVRRQGATLASLLKMMTYLQSLSLQYVSWHHLSKSSVLGLLKLPSLTSLDFRGLYEFPLDYLAGLNQLKTLSLWFMDSSWIRDTSDHHINSVACPQKGQLETLSLGTHSCLSGRLVLDILNEPKSLLGISNLRKLSIETFSVNVIDLAGEVMKVASQSLEVFEWKISEWVWKGKFNPGPVEFELTPNLRSISLEIACLIDKDEDPLPWLISSLEVYSGAKNLQVLFITLGDCGGWSSDDLAQLWQLPDYHVWPKFDSLLTSPRFCSLQKVNIVLMECDEMLKSKIHKVDVSTALTWRMPQLQSAGVLHVNSKRQENRCYREYR